jgi:glucan endo-1,3-alpha-glucosidase
MRFLPLTFGALTAAAFAHIASARAVFAHFMMDNAYAYTIDQWGKDIAAAQQIGIDGFALNWHAPDCSPNMQWTIARIDDAFNVAQQKGFKLMYSFDMSHSVCNTFWNQTFMQHMINKYAGNSATFRWNNNILVSTYGGDQVAQYGNDFFQGLKNAMKSTNTITLAPALTGYS